MMMSKETLFNKVEELEQELIGLGTFLHANPELGNKEFQAVDRITKILEHNGFLVEKGAGRFGYGLPCKVHCGNWRACVRPVMRI